MFLSQGGLAALSEDFYFSWIRDDPQRLHDVLAKQKPLWPPRKSLYLLVMRLYVGSTYSWGLGVVLYSD